MDYLGMGGDLHCARLETIRVDWEVVVAREHAPKQRGGRMWGHIALMAKPI